MTKRMLISNDLADAIKDYQREIEKKDRKWVPFCRMKNVKLVPAIPKGKKNETFEW